MDVDLNKLSGALAGKFLVFDGPDGAGKSTQREHFAQKLNEIGVSVVSCRDPGGTGIGDRIRSVLLDHDLSAMDATCETLLFMASRSQLMAEVIQPALDQGQLVLCDRFVSSTCAYQGAAGFNPRRVIELANLAIHRWPDLTIVLDVDVEQGFERIGRKPQHAGRNRKKFSGQENLFGGDAGDVLPDAMEARPIEFHRKVREMFLDLHSYFPAPVAVVDGIGDVGDVQKRILTEIARVFG